MLVLISTTESLQCSRNTWAPTIAAGAGQTHLPTQRGWVVQAELPPGAPFSLPPSLLLHLSFPVFLLFFLWFCLQNATEVSHVYSTYCSFRTVCIYLLQTKELKGELFLSQPDDKRPNRFIQRVCQFSSTSLAQVVLWTKQAPDGLHFSLFVRLLFGSQ